MQCVYCKTMANLPTATTTLLGSVKLQVLSGYWQDIVRGLERTQPLLEIAKLVNIIHK